MSFVSPRLKIELYLPKKESPITILEGIKSITSSRTLSGEGRLQIDFFSTGRILVETNLSMPGGYYTPQKLFRLNTIVVFYAKKKENDDWRQSNIAYVDSESYRLIASGQFTLSISLPTLEKKFKNAELFIDYQSSEQPNSADLPVQKQTIELAIQDVTSVFNSYKTLPTAIKSVWDNLIVDLMQVKLITDSNPDYSGRFTFGGKYFIGKTTESDDQAFLKPIVMPSGYTTNLVQIFELASNFNFGESINYWQILSSLITEPFYELFIDTLETTPDDNGILDFVNDYEIKKGNCNFVFRKTPFDSMFVGATWYDSDESKFHIIKPEKIKSINVTYDNSEIYSGVHVGLTVLEQANLLLAPVKWNNVLRAITGIPKVLQIKMAGLGFEPNASQADKSSYSQSLIALRDLLYEIFFDPSDMKIGNGSMTTSFDFYRVGKPFKIDDGGITQNEIKIPEYGYITSVTDTLEASGQAYSSISYKWGSYNLFDD